MSYVLATSPPEVFPARAGMIPLISREPGALPGIPRESGDDPKPILTVVPTAAYSPRERG